MSNLHIKPIAPDPNASGRYGSSGERAHREQHAPEELQDAPSDRLEISTGARQTYLSNFSGPDLDFARKALEKTPPLPESRIAQIIDRIATGHYRVPSVFRSVVARISPSLR